MPTDWVSYGDLLALIVYHQGISHIWPVSVSKIKEGIIPLK